MSQIQSADGKPLRFYPTPDRPIPKAILISAGVLAVMTLAFGFVSNRTGIGQFETPVVETVASRGLTLVDQGGPTVSITDAASGETLMTLPTAAGGFAVEALRNLDRYRARAGASETAPFVLALKADGRLVVEDPETGQQVELRAFGEENTRTFAALLKVDGERP
ncbi:putative photosynthetic complex assembly protein [Fulvimarina manganoxydans]|uniref:Putative photosynthetic complex assembly protein n=1 Tax=Fulvimarina manganoxydans TaxID=937218 RepID=A0A1W2EVT8_9HYPH|nr:photosynthetic complex assembly protein PuhC [Fulvimarina manganoxydans]SMD13298.1 putative photosynthetic complex assembly protein [Fulvimarina manganoxydans]